MQNNYERIQFCNRVGATTRQTGIKVGDYLVVGGMYSRSQTIIFKVFSIASGRPVIKPAFTDMDEAIKAAEIMDKTYGEYLCLLEEYPRMDIPQVCMWTVPNGIRMKIALDTVIHGTDELLTPQQDRDTITLVDLKRAYDAAINKVDDYMKFQTT